MQTWKDDGMMGILIIFSKFVLFCFYIWYLNIHRHRNKHTCQTTKSKGIREQKALYWVNNEGDYFSSLCLITLISVMSGPVWRTAQTGAPTVSCLFSWPLSHVITLLLIFTAVKHVSSPNHNKDNRGPAFKYISQQVDIQVCVCWHYSWAVIWSEWWSKCLWWLAVICFPGLWSMICCKRWHGCVCSCAWDRALEIIKSKKLVGMRLVPTDN